MIEYKDGLKAERLSDEAILKGNEIIARSEFSGLQEYRSRCYINKGEDGLLKSSCFLASLRFHSDPAWQLYVVENIEKLDFGFKMCRKRVEIYIDSTKESIYSTKKSSRTESLFDALVYFCSIYKHRSNDQKS